MSQDTIINALNWRYATKIFDPARKVSDADLKVLTESVRLAPTSFGLQQFRLLIVTDPAQRAELVAASWGQHQVQDASHLLLFATLTTLDETYVDRFIDLICRTRNITEDQELGSKLPSLIPRNQNRTGPKGPSFSRDKLSGYTNMMKGYLQGLSPERLREWASKQAYIASGFLMETAALMQIDTCPMEGFDAKQYDKILGLEELGLSAALAVPVGYRSTKDHLAQAAKVRFPAEELVITI